MWVSHKTCNNNEISHPVIDDGGQDPNKSRRLCADDESCCQLDGLVQVSSVHHQNVDIRSLHKHR